MQYTATKNKYKEKDNQPDYRLYTKDQNGEIITENYTKKDGTPGVRWKSFGALWVNRKEDNTVTMSISIEEQAAPQAMPVSPQRPTPEEQMDNLTNAYPTDEINPADIPFN